MKKVTLKILNLILCLSLLVYSAIFFVKETVFVKATTTVELKDGNYSKWIDRVDLSGKDYALEFYEWLIENTDGDGSADVLIDASQEYYVIEKIIDTVEYEKGTTKPTETLAEEAVTKAINENFEEVTSYAFAVYGAFNRDYCQVFWLSDEMLAESSVSYEYDLNSATYTQEIRFCIKNSDFDVREKAFIGENSLNVLEEIEKVNQAVEQIVGGISQNSLDSEKVEYFNEWLTNNNCYRVGEISSKNRKSRSALLGLGGTDEYAPVCEGYARALKVLCDRVGIDCTLVSGNAKGEAHMWNLVKLDDGKWYGVDSTWNDPAVSGVTEKRSGYETKDYLFVGSNTVVDGENFSSSHKMENTVYSGGVAYLNEPIISNERYVAPEKVSEWDCSVLSDQSVVAMLYKTEDYSILNPAYKLIISGNGAIIDYSNQSETPWSLISNFIKEIEIKNGITEIGNYAFSGLAISGITFSQSVTKIKDNAFSDCASLEEVVFLSSVTEYSENAFSGCNSLQTVKAHEKSSAKNLAVEDGYDVEIICSYDILNFDKEMHWLECECGHYKDWSAHQFGEWKVEKDATTSEEGIKERSCDCGYKEQSKIEKKPNSDVSFKGFSDEQIQTLVFYGAIVFGAIIIICILIGAFKKKKD
ncbi:MAG: leucine-rich repeat protein [Clostridia bacterium]|nr:leucine-rich repeat protein [Clostridia bacterium]